MRFMILVKATQDSEAGVMSEDTLITEMAWYHEELAKAGMLVDASGLQPTSQGWRIRYNGNTRTFVDGPFTETKELVAGYTIIQCQTREEAIAVTTRFPNPAHSNREGEIEVCQPFELEDCAQTAAVQTFRAMALPSQQTGA